MNCRYAGGGKPPGLDPHRPYRLISVCTGEGGFAAKPPWRLGRAFDQDHVEGINGVFEVLVAQLDTGIVRARRITKYKSS